MLTPEHLGVSPGQDREAFAGIEHDEGATTRGEGHSRVDDGGQARQVERQPAPSRLLSFVALPVVEGVAPGALRKASEYRL